MCIVRTDIAFSEHILANALNICLQSTQQQKNHTTAVFMTNAINTIVMVHSAQRLFGLLYVERKLQANLFGSFLLRKDAG